MAKQSKRMRAVNEKVDRDRVYPIEAAVTLLNDLAKAGFAESIDVSVNLAVDPRKSDQAVRGATTLPHGSGKNVRVAVFAQGDNADKALAAGADAVGLEDLAERVKGGDTDFDVVIASPDAMRVVGALGRVLGPRGLMPNPKTGTVTADVETAVKNAKSGQVAVPGRPGRHRSRPGGHGGLRASPGQGESGGVDQRSAPGETGILQGPLPQEDHPVDDHGARHPGRRGVAERLRPVSDQVRLWHCNSNRSNRSSRT